MNARLGTILADFTFEAMEAQLSYEVQVAIMEQPEDLGRTRRDLQLHGPRHFVSSPHTSGVVDKGREQRSTVGTRRGKLRRRRSKRLTRWLHWCPEEKGHQGTVHGRDSPHLFMMADA